MQLVYYADISYYRYDVNNDQYIDMHELQLIMEQLEAPQTFLGLQSMISEVDEDGDGKLSFREVRNNINTCH